MRNFAPFFFLDFSLQWWPLPCLSKLDIRYVCRRLLQLICDNYVSFWSVSIESNPTHSKLDKEDNFSFFFLFSFSLASNGYVILMNERKFVMYLAHTHWFGILARGQYSNNGQDIASFGRSLFSPCLLVLLFALIGLLFSPQNLLTRVVSFVISW